MGNYSWAGGELWTKRFFSTFLMYHCSFIFIRIYISKKSHGFWPLWKWSLMCKRSLQVISTCKKFGIICKKLRINIFREGGDGNGDWRKNFEPGVLGMEETGPTENWGQLGSRLFMCLYFLSEAKKEAQPSVFKVYQLNLQGKLICKAHLDFRYFLDFVPSHLQLCLGSDLRLQQRDVTRRGLEKWLEMDLLSKFLNSLSSSKKEIILPFLLSFSMSANLLQWKLFLRPEK